MSEPGRPAPYEPAADGFPRQPLRNGRKGPRHLVRVSSNWPVATPLIVVSGLALVAALAACVAWWSGGDPLLFGRILLVCCALVGALGFSISVGFAPGGRIPWPRVAMVAVCFGIACGLSAFL